MKYIGLFFYLFLTVIQCTFAQVVLTPSTYQFGKVHNELVYQGKVTVKNTAKFKMRLYQPESDCGFLQATFPKLELKPGESIDLSMTMKPKTTSKGVANYHVKFDSNIEKPNGVVAKTWEVKVEALLAPDYYFIPEKMDFTLSNNPEVSKNIKGRIFLDPEAVKNWKLIEVSTDKKGFKAVAVKDKSTNAIDLNLQIMDELPSGVTKGNVHIKVDSGAVREILYPFEITKNKEFLVEPASLFLGDLNVANIENKKWMTQIRSLGMRKIEAIKVEKMPSWLKCKVEKDKSDWILTWQLLTEKMHGAKSRDEQLPDFLVMSVNGDKNVQISIPFKAYWSGSKPRPFLPALKRTPVTGGPPSWYGPTPTPSGKIESGTSKKNLN